MKKITILTLCFLLLISSSVLATEKIEGLTAKEWLKIYPKNIDDIITACNNAILADPKFAEAYNLRGIAYSKRGQFDLALQDYNKTIELKNNFPYVYNNRGVIYANKALYEQAIADFSKAIALNSKMTDTYNNRGNVYLKQGKYDLAVADFNKAIQYHPERKEMEKFNKEFVDLTKSINDNPQNIENYYKRSNLCFDYTVKYVYRDEETGKVHISNTRDANFLLSTVSKTGGLVGIFGGLFSRSRDDYNTRFSCYSPYYHYDYPATEKEHIEWAIFLNDDNDLYNLVIDDSTKVIKSNFQYADAYYNRGFAFLKKSRFDNRERYKLAIKDFSKVIELEPNNKGAYFNRAYAYSYENLHSQAIADYSKAIGIDTSYGRAYQNRGDTYMKKELYDSAISDYSKVIDIMPKYHEIYIVYGNRGKAYFKKGLYAQAVEDCDKSIAKNSWHYDAYFVKAQALEKMGRSAEAVNAYKKFLKNAPEAYESERINEATERIAKLGTGK